MYSNTLDMKIMKSYVQNLNPSKSGNLWTNFEIDEQIIKYLTNNFKTLNLHKLLVFVYNTRILGEYLPPL